MVPLVEMRETFHDFEASLVVESISETFVQVSVMFVVCVVSGVVVLIQLKEKMNRGIEMRWTWEKKKTQKTKKTKKNTEIVILKNTENGK